MWGKMLLKQKIEEVLSCIFFALFMCSMLFLISISDAIDQSIIEARQGIRQTQGD